MVSAPPSQRIPLSASLITQALVAFACLLGAVVLPAYLPEFGGVTRLLLFLVGGVSAIAAGVNLLFGRAISRRLAQMGMRSRVVIPREGLVYLGIMLLLAIGGLVGHSNLLLLVFGLMAGPWVLNGWFVYIALKGVDVRRRARDRVMAGEPVIVDVTISRRPGILSSHMLDVRDEISTDPDQGRRLLGAGIVTIARLPAGQERTGHYEITFPRRGRYQLGPLRVSSRFPLGIGERGQVFSNEQTILIRPKVGRVRPAWLAVTQDQAESQQRRTRRRGVFDDEFHRVREYRAGDSPRAIHWRSTARRGTLMIQEFHQNRESELFVLLDLADVSDSATELIEQAVSVTATLCTENAQSGSTGRCMMAVTGHETHVVCDSHPARFLNEALDVLAVCQPGKAADPGACLRQIAEAGGLQHGRGIILTTRADFCQLTVADWCTEFFQDAASVLARLTIVPITAEALGEMVDLSAASPRSAGETS